VDDAHRSIVEKTRWFLTHGYVVGYPMGRNKPAWKLHQYVWYLAHGERVTGLDHVNGNRQDNRMENLRRATAILQAHNRQTTPKARHRPKQTLRPWRISVRRHGKDHERYFKTEEEAVAWAVEAKQTIIEFEALLAVD
jgi:hypothetical protein